MANTFFRKLQQLVDLSAEDEALLSDLFGRPWEFSPHQVLVSQGSISKDIHLVVDGMACLERNFADGSRSISGLLLPGDLCCTSMEVSRHATRAIVAIFRCLVVKVNQQTFDKITNKLPHLVKALWRLSLADQSIAREWFVNIAHRPPSTRMAHLFCEILARLQAVGLAENGGYHFPLTQDDLGELLGISAVHVNRTLKDLRAANLVVFSNKHLTIPDAEKLKAFCHFRPDYLLQAGRR